MNYRLKDSHSGRTGHRNKWLLLGGIAIVLIGLRFLAPAFSSRVVHIIFAPFMRSSLTVSNEANVTEGLLKSKKQLIAENSQLRAELNNAYAKFALSGNMQAENTELKALLNITTEKKMAAALVLSKPPLSPYDSLVVEFGKNSRITAGDKVYADGNNLLGEVTEVDDTTATVKLYSTAGSVIEATIERNGIALKLNGTGGGNFEIKAPKEVDVVLGDVIIVPSLDQKILGIVRQIDTLPTGSFQHVLVKSPVNIFQLKWVTIEQKAR